MLQPWVGTAGAETQKLCQCGFLSQPNKMAKRYCAQRALELILEDREVFDDDVEGEDSEEEV